MALRRKTLWVSVVAVIVLAATITALGGVRGNENARFDDLRTVLEVVSLIKTQYVDPVDTLHLVTAYIQAGTINGMLKEGLDDPYTRFLEAHAYKDMKDDLSGEFGGIGIMVGIKDEHLTIISPIDGTPGYRAGLRGGDRIVEIDGRPTNYMSLEEAVSLMRGNEGDPVILTIERGKEGKRQTLDIRIVRAIIKSPSLTKVRVLGPNDDPALSAPVGYIRLISFSEHTGTELGEALRKVRNQGAQGIVVDLRNNPGGLLTAAVDVANQFLDRGPILHIVGRDNEKRTVNAFPQGTFDNIPVVVLINEYSASASEIVSGALKDRDRATLVGMTSFGKGLVQTVVPLRDGSALSLTTARYQTAGGHYIHNIGIDPDVKVEITEEQQQELYAEDVGDGVNMKDPQLKKALEVLEQKVAGEKVADLKIAS